MSGGSPEEEALARLAREAQGDDGGARRPAQRLWCGPPGFFSRRRVLSVLGSNLLTLPALGAVCALGWLPWGWAVVPAVLSACALAALWVDERTWARRLPYRIDGFDRIAGTARREEDWEPLIAFEVRLSLASPGPAAPPEAVRHALTILGARVDRLNQRTPELRRSREPAWQADGWALVGRSHFGVYREDVLARWLRRELRLLHKVHPLASVAVRARFTETQIYLAPSDRAPGAA